VLLPLHRLSCWELGETSTWGVKILKKSAQTKGATRAQHNRRDGSIEPGQRQSVRPTHCHRHPCLYACMRAHACVHMHACTCMRAHANDHKPQSCKKGAGNAHPPTSESQHNTTIHHTAGLPSGARRHAGGRPFTDVKAMHRPPSILLRQTTRAAAGPSRLGHGHLAGLGAPDVVRILLDGAVGGELACWGSLGGWGGV